MAVMSILNTAVRCCDTAQVDGFVKYIWEWEAAKDQVSFWLQSSPR